MLVWTRTPPYDNDGWSRRRERGLQTRLLGQAPCASGKERRGTHPPRPRERWAALPLGWGRRGSGRSSSHRFSGNL